MTAVDDAALAVGRLVADSSRGVPPVMVGTVDRVEAGQSGSRSGRGVWVTGLTMEPGAVLPVRVWSQAFDDRVTAGAVLKGSLVLVAATTTQPVQFAILDVAVSAPVLPDLGVVQPL